MQIIHVASTQDAESKIATFKLTDGESRISFYRSRQDPQIWKLHNLINLCDRFTFMNEVIECFETQEKTVLIEKQIQRLKFAERFSYE